VLLVLRVTFGEVDRPPLDVHIVPVVCHGTRIVRRPRDAAELVRGLLAHAWPLVEARAAESLAGRVEEVLAMGRRIRHEERRRRAAIRVEWSRSAAAGLLQPGLFDAAVRAPRRSPPRADAVPDEPEAAYFFRAQVAMAAVFHVR
jgi:hypothetical protein